MMQQHTLLQASSRSSAASYLNTRPSGSTLNAVSRNVLVTRAQQQPRPQQSSSRFTSAEKNWRWFGFHATACPSTPPTECISLAVYDLESGDFYSTLINPKLHNSDFRFTPTSLKGLTKQQIEAEGVRMMEAFHQMVRFVDSKTEPGQTAAVVAHRGFSQQYKQVKQCLDSVAAAAADDMKAHQQPVVEVVQGHESGASSSSDAGSTISSSSSANSHSRCGSTSTNGGRKVHTTAVSSSSSRLTGVKPETELQPEGTPHTDWPSHWRYHDTHIMARFVQLLMPPGSNFSELLDMLDGEPTLEALVEALLPQPAQQLIVQPCHAAYQAAKSTAQLSQVLLQLAAQKPALMDEQQGSSSAAEKHLLESMHVQERYSALVCQPHALTVNQREKYQQMLPRWDRLKREAPLQRYNWLNELPPETFEALGRVASEVYEECDTMDWVTNIVNYMWRRSDVF